MTDLPIDNTDPASDLPCPIVAIGASAGGLEALQLLFDAAPVGTNAAYIVIPHLDPDHESLMADLLSRRTGMLVEQVAHDTEPEAGHVYLIPPGTSMMIENGRLKLEELPRPRGVRRPIDTFFLSLADDLERGFACVVLSGTGSDGSRALRAAKEAGGLTVAQDPETATFDGMPRAAIATGFADLVLTPGEIAGRVLDYFDRLPARPEATGLNDALDRVVVRLRAAVGHDFAGYKKPTMVRRLRRRMQLTGSETLDDYLKRLDTDGTEAEALLQELLINVTGFFRDPDVFERLREDVVPRLIERAGPGRPLRLWVPGCSSGEEAYSLAMLLDEALARLPGHAPQAQIFATDIDKQMLRIAREGRYGIEAAQAVPEPYRSRCLIAQEQGYAVTPSVREMVRFSDHSLIKDPPFTRLDMISCRNLLIYLDAGLQAQALATFRFALREEGVLLLGASEGIGRAEGFVAIDAKKRLYERGPGVARLPSLPGMDDTITSRATGALLPDAVRPLSIASRRVLSRYAPAFLVVDRAGNLVGSSGRLTKYVELPAGAPTTDVTSLARTGLRAPLRRVLRRVEEGAERAAVSDVEIASELGVQVVDVVCERLSDGTRLVVIRDTASLRLDDASAFEDTPEAADAEDELRRVKFRLRSTVEELEAANEELKSSNEEMMSMNEELQSANEELSTVNDELKGKMHELAETNTDLSNFLSSTDRPTIVLDRELRVRMFTPRARDVFPLREADTGRSLTEVTSHLDDDGVIADARRVLETGEPVSREVGTRPDAAARPRTYVLQVTPYDGAGGEIDGVIIGFTDVTQIRAAQASLAEERHRLSLAVEAAGLGVWEWRPDTGEVVLDGATRALFGLPPLPEPVDFADVVARIAPEDAPVVQEALEEALARGGPYAASFGIVGEDRRVLDGIGRPHTDASGTRMVGINRDVTAERIADERRELMIRELNHRVKNTLAVIGGMIRASGRSATDVADFVRRCEARIGALSTAHNLFIESDWQGAYAQSIARTTIELLDAKEVVTIAGDDPLLPPMEAQAVGLILHELTTNAVKYGALSEAEGRVALRFEAEATEAGGTLLHLVWEERGGPPAAPPARTGFGMLLLSKMVAHQHAGTASFDWRPEGLRYALRMKIEDGPRTAG